MKSSTVISEGVEVVHLPPEERETAVADLENPWIADEGPLEAELRRGLAPAELRPRGVAFDAETTVVWDEAGVIVLRRSTAQPDLVALRSPVLLRRERFPGPERLFRTDYLRRGALVGSRYDTEGNDDEGS